MSKKCKKKNLTQRERVWLTSFRVKVAIRPLPSLELITGNAPPSGAKDGIFHVTFHHSPGIQLQVIWTLVHLGELGHDLIQRNAVVFSSQFYISLYIFYVYLVILTSGSITS